ILLSSFFFHPQYAGDLTASDFEAIASKFGKKLSGKLVTRSRCRCKIFKTPVILSRHTENGYVPNTFSIGPFHHDDPWLKLTERIKQKYLLDLITRLSPVAPEPNHDLILPDNQIHTLACA
ncbi:hypothetical protein TorRG33x02_088530, partial [Trema orientale]